MQDVQKTILSQYACAPSLNALIAAWNQAFDPAALIDQWYTQVWNIATAQGYGLDVWGRIVGVQRVLSISSDSFMGFEEASDLTEQGFNTAPWYKGAATSSNVRLSDEGFRQLIYAKAMANITDGSVTSLNAILMALFAGQGDAWVEDNNMTMTYVFNFIPTDVQVSIIQGSGVLPRPAGVAVSYAIRGHA
nr:DUF2612 domain-containing protein [uncultured Acetobacter sp.]